jgi:hypothetical protein
MPFNGLNNVICFPTFGQVITLEDEGLYVTVNSHTGEVTSVLQLVFQEEQWCLFQLKNTFQEEDARWSILSTDADYALKSMGLEEIRHHFSKPEYAEPRGTWQVMKNTTFGFGKFTPFVVGDLTRYALLRFNGHEMLTPILLHRAEDILEAPQSLVTKKIVNQATKTFEWRK